MSGASERIDREIAILSEAIASIASEFRSTYSGYLTALGQATRQQLILACYHLCTQGYPESFLSLSYNQRQKMQQGLRQLAIASAEKLQLLLKQNQEEIQEKQQEDRAGGEDRENHQLPITSPQSPEKLAWWQENMEKAIANILKNLSRDSNRLLQNSGILPKQLPQPILEAAANADSSGDAIAGPPNLLNLIIETVQSDDDDLGDLGDLGDLEDSRDLVALASLRGAPSPNAIHITAINLRLSEIEFADAGVTAWRHQIRNLSARLNTLRRDYNKKQRERSVIEAESAWRACWFEE